MPLRTRPSALRSHARRPAARLRLALAAVIAGALAATACGAGPSPEAGVPASPASPASPVPIAARVAERIARLPGAQVAVAYLSLAEPGDTLFVRADTAFHAASTMKVPILFELYRQADAGTLRLDELITVRNEFRSIVDGSPYTLDAGDDSDSTLYSLVGQQLPLRQLAERMITRSSNLATNVVLERVTPAAVQRLQAALQAPGLRVLRGVEDGKAYRQGLSNSATARALATTLAALERGEVAGPAATAAIREILLRQEFRDEIPAGLPPGTPVAHKTGWITATLHDAAIVYPPGRAPYVLVVLTGGIPQKETAQALIADIARLVHAHHAERATR